MIPGCASVCGRWRSFCFSTALIYQVNSGMHGGYVVDITTVYLDMYHSEENFPSFALLNGCLRRGKLPWLAAHAQVFASQSASDEHPV